MLEKDLARCTHVNLKQLAAEHFTLDFLEQQSERLLSRAETLGNMFKRVGPISHKMTKLDKCLGHYASRELAADLWNFSLPTLKKFIADDGRFNLDTAIASGAIFNPTDDIVSNLDIAEGFMHDTTSKLYVDWLKSLQTKYDADQKNKNSILYIIYKSFSVIMRSGDWAESTTMQTTFTGGSRQNCDWMKDYPDMSRVELEEIFDNSREGLIAMTDESALQSSVRQGLMDEAINKGKLAFVFDHEARKIIFSPSLEAKMAQEEKSWGPSYPDQTELDFHCPAKFVPSSLYPGGGMVHDLLRFRERVFIELYLATHNRR